MSCVLTTPPFDESLQGRFVVQGGGVYRLQFGVSLTSSLVPQCYGQHHHSSWMLGSDSHRTLSICRGWWEAVSLDHCFGVTPIPPQFCPPHHRWLGLLRVIAQCHGSRRT